MEEIKNPGTIQRKTKQIIVTGGCGFIGSHLIDSLLKTDNVHVICIDNCFSGSKTNITHHLNNPNFEFIRHDITTPISLYADEIYHLASPASPVFYQHDGIYTIKTNVLGTLNMLEIAKTCNAKILLASTSEIYGDPTIHPQPESYWGNVNPTGIRACYDESKRIGETLMYQYNRQHTTNIRVARIFNTYGPRMLENDGRIISNFICQALNNNPLTIYGTGQQTRSFCYVSDTVKGLIALMNSDYIHPVNIGNPTEHSITELAQIFSNIFSKNIPVVFKPLPSDDPQQRCPDIRIATNILHWVPSVTLKNGLSHTITDFKKRIFDSNIKLT